MAILEVEDLRVRYGVIEAVKGISMRVEEGEIVTLIGANGAGKTTTLRTISGLQRPARGEIRFRGERIDGLPAHLVVRKGIGHAPEGRRVFSRLTVRENLEMGAYARSDRRAVGEDLGRIYRLFPILEQRKAQWAGTLSGGEQQMLAIGRALMGRPRLLLLDEPSMGLAPMLVSQIFSILEEIHRQGVTVLLVEQNARQALRLAGRGYVLETGRIVLSGRARELLEDEGVRRAYFG
ncbi:MAG: ABC transporter ATP-binding protein [Actinomycetota bacterium]